MLRLLLGAKLSRTEMELEYYPRGKITDYSVQLRGQQYGVSVTRALKYRGTFTRTDARKLLEKKLMGVLQSTRTVMDERWSKQVTYECACICVCLGKRACAWGLCATVTFFSCGHLF